MSVYLGPFYLRDGDLFIFTAVALLLIVLGLGVSIPYIGTTRLLFLVILFLLARGFLPVGSESVVYAVFLLTLLTALIFPLSTALIFIVLVFLVLKLTKQI